MSLLEELDRLTKKRDDSLTFNAGDLAGDAEWIDADTVPSLRGQEWDRLRQGKLATASRHGGRGGQWPTIHEFLSCTRNWLLSSTWKGPFRRLRPQF